MTAIRIVTPNRWIGGTGEQPTEAAIPRVRIGDTFYDYDTGLWYITYDGTNWVSKDDPTSGHDITGLADGVKTISTAGTDEALAASTAAKLVIIQSQTDNTGLIAVGNTGVDATEATGTGVILYAGDSVAIPCDNLADIYIDATVAGNGVRYTYFT